MQLVVGNDVLDRGVAEVPNGEHLSGGSSGCNGAQVLREGEDGPIVRDRAEVRVFGVVERSVVSEVGANDCVYSRLVGGTGTLCRDETAAYIGFQIQIQPTFA